MYMAHAKPSTQSYVLPVIAFHVYKENLLETLSTWLFYPISWHAWLAELIWVYSVQWPRGLKSFCKFEIENSLQPAKNNLTWKWKTQLHPSTVTCQLSIQVNQLVTAIFQHYMKPKTMQMSKLKVKTPTSVAYCQLSIQEQQLVTGIFKHWSSVHVSYEPYQVSIKCQSSVNHVSIKCQSSVNQKKIWASWATVPRLYFM